MHRLDFQYLVFLNQTACVDCCIVVWCPACHPVHRPAHPQGSVCGAPPLSGRVTCCYLQTHLSLTCSRVASSSTTSSSSSSSVTVSDNQRHTSALCLSVWRLTASCSVEEPRGLTSHIDYLQGNLSVDQLQCAMADWCCCLPHVCHTEHLIRTTPLWAPLPFFLSVQLSTLHFSKLLNDSFMSGYVCVSGPYWVRTVWEGLAVRGRVRHLVVMVRIRAMGKHFANECPH